jgi:hypothetical protein
MISFRIDDCELISLKQGQKLEVVVSSSDNQERDNKDDPFDYS